MVVAADQTAGQSAGTSTEPLAGWMMEEEPHQLSRSDLEIKPQHLLLNFWNNLKILNTVNIACLALLQENNNCQLNVLLTFHFL